MGWQNPWATGRCNARARERPVHGAGSARGAQGFYFVGIAVTLQGSARVPVWPTVGFYPFAYAGVTAQEAMYDYGKLASRFKKVDRGQFAFNG